MYYMFCFKEIRDRLLSESVCNSDNIPSVSMKKRIFIFIKSIYHCFYFYLF